MWNQLEYCPPNITVHDIWWNYGISHCFFNTVSSIVLTSIVVIFGSIEFLAYSKYATRIEDLSQIPNTNLFNFQMILLILMSVLPIFKHALELYSLNNAHFSGYTVNESFILKANIYWNNLNRFLACDVIFVVYIVHVFHSIGSKRTFFFTATSYEERAWFRTSNLLDIIIHKREYFDAKCEE